MNNLKVEYLIVFDIKDSFCSDVESFNSLIQSISNIKVNDTKIIYKDIEFKYLVEDGELNNDDGRYFHIQLYCLDIKNISQFETLLKSIRIILNRNSTRNIEVLWDDISFFYAQKAYPLIHEIENLMRKLITKFMLINVGVGWTKKNVPDIVKDSVNVKDRKKKDEVEYLYKTDFIQLSNFLFEEYSTDNISNFIKKIKLENDNKRINMEDVKQYIPVSNWERHFSSIVKCEYEYLKNRWEELYKLRCKVAHNNRMNRQDYLDTKKLVDEIKEKLVEALQNIDKLSISDIDKEIISESMVLNTNEIYGLFIHEWKKLDEFIFTFLVNKKLLIGHERYSSIQLINELSRLDSIPNEMIDTLNELRRLRNRIVHENGLIYDIEVIKHYINYIEGVKKTIAESW